jgi:hypothetical protein
MSVNFLSLLVLAQTAGQAQESIWPTIIQGALTLLGFIFAWLLRTYGKKLTDMIAEKTGSPLVAEIASRAFTTVLSLYQTEVRHLKGTLEWTPEAQARLKQSVIDHIKASMDPTKLSNLAGAVGVDEAISHHVEAAVMQAKQIGKAAKAAGAPVADPTRE